MEHIAVAQWTKSQLMQECDFFFFFIINVAYFIEYNMKKSVIQALLTQTRVK